MRLIDADALMPLFVEKAYTVQDRHGVKLGENWLLNYDEIKEVINNAPTVETSVEHFVDLKTFKHVDCEYLTPCGICKLNSSYKQIKFCNEFQPT